MALQGVYCCFTMIPPRFVNVRRAFVLLLTVLTGSIFSSPDTTRSVDATTHGGCLKKDDTWGRVEVFPCPSALSAGHLPQAELQINSTPKNPFAHSHTQMYTNRNACVRTELYLEVDSGRELPLFHAGHIGLTCDKCRWLLMVQTNLWSVSNERGGIWSDSAHVGSLWFHHKGQRCSSLQCTQRGYVSTNAETDLNKWRLSHKWTQSDLAQKYGGGMNSAPQYSGRFWWMFWVIMFWGGISNHLGKYGGVQIFTT